MTRRSAVGDDIKAKAEELSQAERPARDRSWDQNNPPSAFRIRRQDSDRLKEHAQRLRLSRDALASGLMWAALDALEDGRLDFEISDILTEKTDKRGRFRTYARKVVTPAWTAERISDSDD